MSNGINGIHKKSGNILEKLIDKSEEQEHIPFLGALIIIFLWTGISATLLKDSQLFWSMFVLAVVLCILYFVYNKFSRRRKESKILFREILNYFKLGLKSKEYVESTKNPDLQVIDVKKKNNDVILIVQTPNQNHLSKGLIFDLIKMDKSEYEGETHKFPTTLGYVKIMEIGENSQAEIIKINPNEKKYYREKMNQLKRGLNGFKKDWKIKCNLREEFSYVSISDLKKTYESLLSIRNASD
jgi:Ca2+/Na+ antiporter